MWKYTLNTKINPNEFGPFVNRQWFKAKGEKHKLSYKAPRRVKRDMSKTGNRDMETKAHIYAQWLAQRDGVTLPAIGRVCIHYAGVMAPNSKGNLAHEQRIRAVSFGDVTITLPNWDFVAIPPQEQTVIFEYAA